MQVLRPKGLFPKTVRHLHQSLETAAKDMVGREMIYDLADHARAFLANHNSPPPQANKLSFHEQMVIRMEHDQRVKKKSRSSGSSSQ
jgi:translation initiation factor 2-alpha kinase 4